MTVASLQSRYGICNGDKGGRRQTLLRKQAHMEGRCQAGEEQKSGHTLTILTQPEEKMGSWRRSEQHWGPSHMGEERESYTNPPSEFHYQVPEVQDSSRRPEGSIRPAEDSVLSRAYPQFCPGLSSTREILTTFGSENPPARQSKQGSWALGNLL